MPTRLPVQHRRLCLPPLLETGKSMGNCDGEIEATISKGSKQISTGRGGVEVVSLVSIPGIFCFVLEFTPIDPSTLSFFFSFSFFSFWLLHLDPEISLTSHLLLRGQTLPGACQERTNGSHITRGKAGSCL